MRRVLSFSIALNAVLLAVGGAVSIQQDGIAYARAKVYEVIDGSPYTDPARPFYESSAFKSAVSTHAQVPLRVGDIVFAGDDQLAPGPWTEAFGTLRVRNWAIVGNTLEGFAQQVDGVIAARPAALFLSIGAVDLARPHRLLGVESVAGGIREILERVRQESPATEAYILSAVPAASRSVRDASYADSLTRLNGQLMEVASATGTTYVDTASKLLTASGTLRSAYTEGDGMLNGSGYRVLLTMVRPHVQEALHKRRGMEAVPKPSR